ncbi:MAG: LD-carboxypeptidase [Candidatus Binatia bacterium]
MREASAQVRPRHLVAGDRVAVVAPASRYDSEKMARGVAVLQSWSLQVDILVPSQPLRYMSGSDDQRAACLTEAFAREDIAAVIAVRGGYGAARLLGHFDPAVATTHPKIFLGYSDLTIVLSRLRREAGLVCFHGPMVASDLARLGPDELERFRRFLFGEEGWWAGKDLECRKPGSATGRLAGGCLSIIATTIGTPYEIDTRGSVLFLEDIAEPPYRIDRLLTHLLHARKFEGVAAVVLGKFHDCDPPNAPGQVMAIADEILGRLGIPVVSGFDAGHLSGGAVLPMGCQVLVNADAGSIELQEPVFGNSAPVSSAARDLARVAAAALRRGPGSLGR